MPFDGEKASYAPLRRILQSDKVRRLQERFRLASIADADRRVSAMPASTIDGAEIAPDLILAVDGSYFPAEVKNGYPGAEIGYITVAAVLIMLDRLRSIARADIIDPQEHRETQKKTSIDTAIPGRGVLIDSEKTPRASMRRVLFEALENYRVFADSETLLETYQELMRMAKETGSRRCPCCDADGYSRQVGEYKCDVCGDAVFSTDALRLHELFAPHESCEKLYGHVMNTLEKLWLIHALRAFERRGNDWLVLMGKMAFVVDGPLAVYGTPAWLSEPIRAELARLNRTQKAATGIDMMILGIEKSGVFVRHFEMLDQAPATAVERGHVICLDNQYIRRHIVPSPDDRPYGRNTYFGRKVLYKSAFGHRLVVSLACYDDRQSDLRTALFEQFPRLGDVLRLLDGLSSNLYPNSVSPLIAAHSEAAIPLNLGKQILEDIARKSVARG